MRRPFFRADRHRSGGRFTRWRGIAAIILTAALVVVAPVPAAASPRPAVAASKPAAAPAVAVPQPAPAGARAVGGGVKAGRGATPNLRCIPGECGPDPDPGQGGCTADVGWRRDGSTVGRNGTLVFWGDIWCTLLINVQAQSRIYMGQVDGFEVTTITGGQINQNIGFWHVKSQGSLPVARLSRPDLPVEFNFMLTGPPGWTWNFAQPTTASGATQTCWPFGYQTISCSVVSSPQHMRPYWYVALGDSYSAGTGTTGSEIEPSGCHRTATAYPSAYRDLLEIYFFPDIEFTFLACHGATTEDMYTQQLTQVAAQSLGGYPDLITVTIGGNDLIARDSGGNPVGFRGVLMDCLIPGLSSCNPTLDVAAATARLDFAYRSIKQRSGGNTTVQVLQYPQILPDSGTGLLFGCPGFGRLDDTELPRIKALWDQADVLIRDRALAANAAVGMFSFEPVYTENSLAGHDVCSSNPWALDLGVTSGYNETAFHPNDVGHSRLAVELLATWV